MTACVQKEAHLKKRVVGLLKTPRGYSGIFYGKEGVCICHRMNSHGVIEGEDRGHSNLLDTLQSSKFEKTRTSMFWATKVQQS